MLFQEQLTKRENMRPLANAMLDHPEVRLMFANETDELSLGWEEQLRDTRHFSAISNIIINTKQLNDAEFWAQIVPTIKRLLQTSQIFQDLDSPNIKVTAGHQGTTPFAHTMNVVHSLRTQHLSPDLRAILRITAFYHDIGKGLSASLSAPELERLMTEHKQTKHSHPSHAEVSTLVVKKMLQISQFIEQKISWERLNTLEDPTQLLLQIILNHHYFEEIRAIMPRPDQLFQEPSILPSGVTAADQQAIRQEIDRYSSEQLYILLCTYWFSWADVSSNAQYHKYWPAITRMMGGILRFWSKEGALLIHPDLAQKPIQWTRSLDTFLGPQTDEEQVPAMVNSAE